MSLSVTGTGPSFRIETRYANVVPFLTLTVLIDPETPNASTYRSDAFTLGSRIAEPKLRRPSGSTFETQTMAPTIATSRSRTRTPAARRGHRCRTVPVAVDQPGGASGGRTTVSTSRPYSYALHPFHGHGRTVSSTGGKENDREHPSVRRPRSAPRAPATPHAAGRERPEQDRRRDHALRRFDGLRLHLDRLVRAMDRSARGEIPLRSAEIGRASCRERV